MTYRIGGQVVDQGSGVSGQPVFVVDTGDADPTNWTIEAATTTNADGSWSVIVNSGDLERYHAVAQFEDGATLKNAESKPFVTGQPVVRPVEIPIQFEIPSPAISAGTAIPDSVVSRTDDDSTFTTSGAEGIIVNPNSDFSKIGARVSSLTGEDVTRARLYDYSSGTYEATVSVTGPGDSFYFEYDFKTGTDYGFEIDRDGGIYAAGLYDTTDFFVSGTDLDLVGRSTDGSATKSGTSAEPVNVNDIGNPDNL